MKILVSQSCLILCDPMDCSPPGFSAHGTLQSRTLEWVAISSSRELSQPGVNLSYQCLLHCMWIVHLLSQQESASGSGSEEFPAMQETWVQSLGQEDLLGIGGRNSYSLHYFCPDNSRDRGAWQVTVLGVTESDII